MQIKLGLFDLHLSNRPTVHKVTGKTKNIFQIDQLAKTIEYEKKESSYKISFLNKGSHVHKTC